MLPEDCDKRCHAGIDGGKHRAGKMQILLNGLISGCATALLAVSFQLVYLPTRVFFIGLAGLYSLTPYFAWAAHAAGLSPVFGVFTAVLAVVALAVVCEWANHAPLTRKGASDGAHLVSSLGIYILLVQAAAMIWGSETKTLRTGIDSTVHLGGAIITGAQQIGRASCRERV